MTISHWQSPFETTMTPPTSAFPYSGARFANPIHHFAFAMSQPVATPPPAPAPVCAPLVSDEAQRRASEEPFRLVKAAASEEAAERRPLCQRNSKEWYAMVAALQHSDRALRCMDVFLDSYPAYRFLLAILTAPNGRVPREKLLARSTNGGECPPALIPHVTVLSIGQLPFSITAAEVHGLLEYFVPGAVVFVTTELAEKARRRGLWFAVVRTEFVNLIIATMHHRVLFGPDEVRHLVPRCGTVHGFRLIAELLAERDVVARAASEDLDASLNVHGKFNGGVWPVTVQTADADMKHKVVPFSGRCVDYNTSVDHEAPGSNTRADGVEAAVARSPISSHAAQPSRRPEGFNVVVSQPQPRRNSASSRVSSPCFEGPTRTSAW